MSGKHNGDSSNGAKKISKAEKTMPDEKKGRKQRTGDLGRALRSIYDDTVREEIPDDFMDLLGKLS